MAPDLKIPLCENM